MKVLITGATGFVGAHVVAHAQTQLTVHGITRTATPGDQDGVSYHLMDLLDTDKLASVFKEVKPDVVIHTAAIANIDFCEANQGTAESVNVNVTETIARLCYESNIRMIHCSTDTVFDGSESCYVEEDIPDPVNFYGRTKVQSENIVLQASERNVVARLALVIGFPVMRSGHSFVADLVTKLKKNERVMFPQNEIRTPIDVITLGMALTELAMMQDFAGIIHLAGNTRIDRFSMAKQIASTFHFSGELVGHIDSNAIPGRAPRPNDASLDNTKAKRVLRTRMLSLREALALTKKGKQGESI